MSSPLNIWIDDQIAERELFGSIGVLHTFSGRTVTRDDLLSADALIVRSVTRVDASLLDGTHVKFVGSVTAGADHLDTFYLQARHIQYALAPGFNARPVAEYVMAVLFLLAGRRGVSVDSWTLGIVGVGQVGSMVRDFARSVGMTVMLNDPPREAQNAVGPWETLERVLEASDVVTLHVPLTEAGEYATRRLIGGDQLASLKPNGILINAARGGVVDEKALTEALSNKAIGGAVIDTWENEPEIDVGLLAACDVATPHIAGHSVGARQRGARAIRSALASWVLQGCIPVYEESNGADAGARPRVVSGHGDGDGAGMLDAHGAFDETSASDVNACEGVIYDGLTKLTPKETADRLASSCPLGEIDALMKHAGGGIAAEFDTIRDWAGRRDEIVV